APTLPGGFDNPAYATATMGSGGLVAGVAGATVEADDNPMVTTKVGSGKTVNVSGNLDVQSLVYQHAFADGFAVAVSALGAIGLVDPTANAGGKTTTEFDGNVQNASTVTVSGNVDASTQSKARAKSFAVGAGINVAEADATTSPMVTTTVGGSI